MSQVKKTIQSLDRAFEIVELLAGAFDGLRLADVSAETGLVPQTVQSILRTLEVWGLCVQMQRGGAYYLGPVVAKWGRAWRDGNSRIQLAEPIVKALNRDTGEYTLLAEWQGERVYRAIERQGHRPISISPVFVSGEHWHTMATVKVLLAGLDEHRRQRVLMGMNFAQTGPRAVTDRRVFIELLQTVGREGYAESVDESAEGVAAVAVPVKRPDGATSALGLSLLSSRYQKEKTGLLNRMIQSAGSIEKAWQ